MKSAMVAEAKLFEAVLGEGYLGAVQHITIPEGARVFGGEATPLLEACPAVPLDAA